ncbi:sulfonate transport system substrate-binding protein [Methylobacterium sp. PvP062]|jgi:sulfonate transport system substrate-binding protein|uniref:NitT/TauT family transport system substrate-binding protein/sulfonate transport system substrate-binding protein n=2 Tax=Methylobacterium radiotolerans TaxID=31998 RepID=A0ABV2N8Q6_9HYPH|nr:MULTISPECIES: aliphatic sulfonate ABC transporter substrate-binding protein [Methylobacterium]MBY0395312.1 aliphatic sulfonate ABC transporter substrate-binding protein [Thermoleophilia bacterium]MCX7335245.1 aliphatic sulfonate ABC transporter substrate-binding protein [Hyphomicrobiales bacterium]ACB23334.1 aliphatic sulfonates family ABC transporter, periplsmic ligand-binding protein [Methylobacterium radiotolerans JCM 2831]KIU36373.1 ABC transporter substrate-binding protein [Methylobacte
MLDRRALLAALAALPLAPALAPGARAAEPGVLRIGYQKNGILVVAKQQKIIEKRLEPLGYAVRWVEFSFGPPLLEALSLDGIDLGQTGDAPPIFAQAARSNLVYAAAQEAGGSGAGILLPKGSEIRSLAELRGRRVAFAKASSSHNLTIAALEKAGLSYADIEPVTLAPADAAAAFARGSIDAWTIWDPYFAIAEQGEGVRVLVRATDVTPQNNFFLASRPFAESRAPVLTAVIDALGEVAAWCTQNRGAVAELLSQGTGVPLAATRRAVDRTDYVIGPMTDRVAAEQQRIADRFHALRLIPKPIRIADAVWTPPARNG